MMDVGQAREDLFVLLLLTRGSELAAGLGCPRWLGLMASFELLGDSMRRVELHLCHEDGVADPESPLTATSFMFGIADEAVLNNILIRLFDTPAGASSGSALFVLCTLRLVCRAWRVWIDQSMIWTTTKRLYQEDLQEIDELIWAEVEE